MNKGRKVRLIAEWHLQANIRRHVRQTAEIKPDDPKLASFRQNGLENDLP
jgi:hypothetical protein